MRINHRIHQTLTRGAFGQRAGVSEAQFFASVARVTPVRAPSIEADALVPALQCALVGAGVFCVVTPLAMLTLRWPVGFVAGFVAGGLGAGVYALDALSAARTSLYATETLEDNLAAHAETASAAAAAETVDLRVIREDLSESYPPVQIRALPVDGERLRAFAHGALTGAPLTQTEWAGSDKLFSRTEFDDVMTMLLDLGVIAWKSGRDNAQGRTLTVGGKHALDAWLAGRAQLTHARTHASTPPAAAVGDSLE